MSASTIPPKAVRATWFEPIQQRFYNWLARKLLHDGESWREQRGPDFGVECGAPGSPTSAQRSLIAIGKRDDAVYFSRNLTQISEAARSAVDWVWIHAASAGELEALWSVAEELARRRVKLILTVFSSSALAPVRRLESQLVAEHGGDAILFAGFSPVEGQWHSALSVLRPKLFLTAKYEAWPELWAALSRADVPLMILGARSRASFRVARMVCLGLGARVPQLHFLTTLPEEQNELKRDFRTAQLDTTGDPRWDRVAQRMELDNARAREIRQALADLPHPWGVLGSSWAADLENFGPALAQAEGTLFVVPHQIAESAMLEQLNLIQRLRPGQVLRTQGKGSVELQQALRSSERPRTVMVDEMGFLLELYTSADWAFVGGGFGAGVHSTLEPALAGIPVACGPKKAMRFPEIKMLRETGQLTLVEGPDSIGDWLKSVTKTGTQNRASWKEAIGHQLGATKRVVERVARYLN